MFAREERSSTSWLLAGLTVAILIAVAVVVFDVENFPIPRTNWEVADVQR